MISLQGHIRFTRKHLGEDLLPLNLEIIQSAVMSNALGFIF